MGYTINMSGSDIENRLMSFSNRNLLDNWYFAKPVDQRGISGEITNTYGFDRWFGSYNANVAGKITFSAKGKYAVQKLETSLYKKLVGMDITCSVQYGDGKVESGTLTLGDSGTRYFFQGERLHAMITSENHFELWSNMFCNVIAAKLELGDHQTLAHQDADGKWVLNELPDYGEQLARCQRYFQRISNKSGGTSIVGYGQCESSTLALINIPLPVEMRALPTVTAYGVRIRKAGGSYITMATPYTIGGQRLNTNSVQFSIATETDLTAALNAPLTIALMAESTPSYIDLSADL